MSLSLCLALSLLSFEFQIVLHFFPSPSHMYATSLRKATIIMQSWHPQIKLIFHLAMEAPPPKPIMMPIILIMMIMMIMMMIYWPST